MATCVRCKKEIEESLQVCPHCGAKQNMFIDANKVVSKNLIDSNEFDPKKDVLKTPKVEIIIDDSEAATPVFFEKENKDISPIEELPNPDVKAADISDYNDNIDMSIFEEKKEEVIEEEIKEIEPIFIDDEEPFEIIKSRRINIFNTIFNLIFNIGCLFLVGFGYFYETSDMLVIRIIKTIKNNLVDIVHLPYSYYAGAFGVFSLFMALLFLIIYIVKIFINIKKKQSAVRSNYIFGISMAFIVSTLYFNTEIGIFKLNLNYFFRIYSYLIMAFIIISLLVNMICRCADPLNLSFRWGFMRYNLENNECLPKLAKMNSYLVRRKLVYIFIVAIVLFNIYLGYLINLHSIGKNSGLSLYSNLVSNYIAYKGTFDGWFNIFKIIAPTAEIFYINGYGTYTMMLFAFVILVCICLIAKEYVFKKKDAVVSRASSIIYILTLITFVILAFRSGFTLLSILDGAGVNENIPLMVRDCMVAQSCSYLVCFVLVILDRTLNRNIVRKELSIYRS